MDNASPLSNLIALYYSVPRHVIYLQRLISTHLECDFDGNECVLVSPCKLQCKSQCKVSHSVAKTVAHATQTTTSSTPRVRHHRIRPARCSATLEFFSPDTALDKIEVRSSHNHGGGLGATRLTSGHYSLRPRAYSSVAITSHTKRPLDYILAILYMMYT